VICEVCDSATFSLCPCCRGVIAFQYFVAAARGWLFERCGHHNNRRGQRRCCAPVAHDMQKEARVLGDDRNIGENIGWRA
jgi:hypothetical protein